MFHNLFVLYRKMDGSFEYMRRLAAAVSKVASAADKLQTTVETGYRCNNVGIEMQIIDKVVVYDIWVFYIQLLQCALQFILIVAVDGSAGILCIQTVQCAGRLVQVMCLLEYFNNHINH